MSQTFEKFGTVVIAGVGLIGGSIAAALRTRGYAGKIIGLGRSASRLQAAIDAGIIDSAATHPNECSQQPALYVYCTPVNHIVDGIQAAAESAAAGSIFTDAGSVKESICKPLAHLPKGLQFVGSHPLAGSEKTGFEHADAQLFENRVCVVTPGESSSTDALTDIGNFWESIGCNVVRLTPVEHDRHLAVTSHLPHVIAAALAGLLTDENQLFAATGFRDTTRVASGDPNLWTAIVQANPTAILDAIEATEQRLAALKLAIKESDAAKIRTWLQQAKDARDNVFGE